jgi:AraC-like DNA-binding protein
VSVPSSAREPDGAQLLEREQVAAGLLSWVLQVGKQRYGVARAELLAAAPLSDACIADANAQVPLEALIAVVRALSARSGDAGLGLALAAEFDLRTQGFWGYALLSCATLRERLELELRFQRLRSPLALSFWEVGGTASLELDPRALPADVAQVLIEWQLAFVLQQFRGQLASRVPPVELWLTCAERPHHAALHAALARRIVFRAPCNRLQLSSSLLAHGLAGDPHLGKLAIDQLERHLKARRKLATRTVTLASVRSCLRAQLGGDPSLPSVARKLGLGPRTLQRQLDRFGTSFHQLLEEVRCARAIDFLRDTDESVERIAAQLGYNDPSNFRRAFRRWTGVAPTAFRSDARGSARDQDKLAAFL